MRILNVSLITDAKISERLQTDSEYVKVPHEVAVSMQRFIIAGDFSEMSVAKFCDVLSDRFWTTAVISYRVIETHLLIFVEEVSQEVLDSNIFHIPHSTGLH